MGSIQAAIKKLLKNGYISVAETVENGKQKKLYSITEEGKRQFDVWVNSAIGSNTFKSPELAKIYFMGLSEKENRVKLIENHISELRKTYADLDRICIDGESMSAELQGNEIVFFQLKTAEYGRDIVRFNIEWYERLLNNLR